MSNCYSYAQSCSLGPLPPRTPSRADPQVPREHKLGPCRHGKIGAFYFYADGSDDDPAFGFIEIEVSVQQVAASTVRLDIYCIADGYQTARGVGAQHPLKIAVMAGERRIGLVEWRFADVLCGHADPMTHSHDVTVKDGDFASIDQIILLATAGRSRPCDDGKV